MSIHRAGAQFAHRPFRRKGGKPPFGSTALDLQLQWKRTLATLASPVYKMHEAASV